MPKLTALASALVLLAASPAAAFHNEGEFLRGGELGGGGGQTFTGSVAARGLDCSVCHVEPAGEAYFTVATHPAGPITDGRYVPGQTYHLVIRLEGEHAGVGGMLNRNTFLMEILDDAGAPAGAYESPSEPTTEVIEDALLAGRGARSNITEWSAMWTAPEGAGPLTISLAGVDGDGAEGGRLAPDGDPWNDDVFAASLRVLPEGAPAEPLSAEGCSVSPSGGRGGSMWGWMIGVCLSLLIVVRRRGARRIAGLVIAGVAALAVVACEEPAQIVDCTRTICAPDGGDDPSDAGPHHEEHDAGNVFPLDGGEEPDAGPHHEEHDGGATSMTDAGDACGGDPPTMEPGGVFCMDSCYCRTSMQCIGVAGAESCCEDTPVCPMSGERWAGCAPRMPIMVGDAPGCAHGQCFCSTDDRCYAMATAPGCCAGEIRCF